MPKFLGEFLMLLRSRMVGLCCLCLGGGLLQGSSTQVAPLTPLPFTITAMSRYESRIFEEGAAEIVQYHAASQRVFSVNAAASTVDVLRMQKGTLRLETQLDVGNLAAATGVVAHALGAANSLAVSDKYLAVAVEASPSQLPGVVALFDVSSLTLLRVFEAGALPDMLTFNRKGDLMLVANEGEPNDAYTIDPEGSVSLIDLSQGWARAQSTLLDFRAFDPGGARAQELNKDLIRVFGPQALPSQDFEPEFISISPDQREAFVTLQENNAVAVVDLRTRRIDRLLPLGYKDYAQKGDELDISDKDGGAFFASYAGLYGMYLPDGIASMQVGKQTYFITANEGDSRDYSGFSEEARIGDLSLSSQWERLVAAGSRLKVTTTRGLNPQTQVYDRAYAFGTRSFSIWTIQGQQVFDSRNDFEQIIHAKNPLHLNSDHASSMSFDSRSDDKGPEPEGVVVGRIKDRTYAFIGLERDSGIMVYDVTEPQAAKFVQYINTRNFEESDITASAAGDLGPEGLAFVAAEDSPNGYPLLIVGYEVSGSVVVFEIR